MIDYDTFTNAQENDVQLSAREIASNRKSNQESESAFIDSLNSYKKSDVNIVEFNNGRVDVKRYDLKVGNLSSRTISEEQYLSLKD